MAARALLLKIIKGRQRIGPELTVHADYRDSAWMRDHLVTALRREGYPPERIGEFVMEIRPALDPSRLLATFAATAREER
jgi:hypothetical protein